MRNQQLHLFDPQTLAPTHRAMLQSYSDVLSLDNRELYAQQAQREGLSEAEFAAKVPMRVGWDSCKNPQKCT